VYIDSILVRAVGLVLAWIMGTAGLHKLRHPRHYAALIGAYRLLPQQVAFPATLLLGMAEVASAVLIGSVPCLIAGPVAVIGLLCLYCGAIGINLMRGRGDIDCGCSGPLRARPIAPWMLLRNAVLILLAAWLGFRGAGCAAGWGEWLAAAAIAAIGVLLYNALDFLMARDSVLEDV